MISNIDRLVAEKVMGWYRGNGANGSPDYYYADGMNVGKVADFLPFERMGDAWDVMKCMRAEGWCGSVRMVDRYGCRFGKIGLSGYTVNADTAPMAICLAALKAKGVDIESINPTP